jgi:serine/threonine-protein kinase
MVKRFEREAQIASSIDHPNAVTIFESGRAADGQAYIAMELLDGETLETRLQRQGPLPAPYVLELLLPAVRAVAAAHGRGIVHRDLKPDNIFIARKQTESGTEEVIKVLDFGIAARLTSAARRTEDGKTLGTPLYMAPEQLQGGEATLRSDVFALGVILTEALTGRLPWGEVAATTSPTAAMARVVRPAMTLSELLPRGNFHEALQTLVAQLLARDPAQRPADAGVVLRALQPIVIAITPGMQLELFSARLLAVGPTALSSMVDSTATLSGRETKPLAVVLPRRRWWVAPGLVILAAAAALLWQKKPPPRLLGQGTVQGLPAPELKGSALHSSASPELLLPARADSGTAPGSDEEPPPAGFVARPAELAPAAPPVPPRRHRHRAPIGELSPGTGPGGADPGASPRPHRHRTAKTVAPGRESL